MLCCTIILPTQRYTSLALMSFYNCHLKKNRLITVKEKKLDQTKQQMKTLTATTKIQQVNNAYCFATKKVTCIFTNAVISPLMQFWLRMRAQQPPPTSSLNVLQSSDDHSLFCVFRASSTVVVPGQWALNMKEHARSVIENQVWVLVILVPSPFFLKNISHAKSKTILTRKL